MPRSSAVALLTLLVFAVAPAWAQQGTQTQAGPESGQVASREYMAAMERMQEKMKSADDADPAKAFARKMIAHHEGSIEMSQTVLKHAKDAKIRRMANKMVGATQGNQGTSELDREKRRGPGEFEHVFEASTGRIAPSPQEAAVSSRADF